MSFLSTLKPEELGPLRGIVRKVHFAEVVKKFGPNHPAVTDRECDRLIENIGPEIVEQIGRAHV